MAAAVGQPDAHAGELPVVYVTLKPEATAQADELLAAARELVSERAAAPVRVEILAQMALTAVGKVAKAELRLRAAEHLFAQLLDTHGIAAELTVTADANRGSVVLLHCAQADGERAASLLARFPYTVDVLTPQEKE
jgi:fatty-acyl-CoA synthase